MKLSRGPVGTVNPRDAVHTPPTRDRSMPYVNIRITAGATRDQKSAIVRDVTESLQRHLGKHPEHTHVVIDEVAEENWGYAGMLTDDWKRLPERGHAGTPEG